MRPSGWRPARSARPDPGGPPRFRHRTRGTTPRPRRSGGTSAVPPDRRSAPSPAGDGVHALDLPPDPGRPALACPALGRGQAKPPPDRETRCHPADDLYAPNGAVVRTWPRPLRRATARQHIAPLRHMMRNASHSKASEPSHCRTGASQGQNVDLVYCHRNSVFPDSNVVSPERDAYFIEVTVDVSSSFGYMHKRLHTAFRR